MLSSNSVSYITVSVSSTICHITFNVTLSLNIFYSCGEYTEKDWVLLEMPYWLRRRNACICKQQIPSCQ